MQILLDVHFLESNKSIREFPKLSVNFLAGIHTALTHKRKDDVYIQNDPTF